MLYSAKNVLFSSGNTIKTVTQSFRTDRASLVSLGQYSNFWSFFFRIAFSKQ